MAANYSSLWMKYRSATIGLQLFPVMDHSIEIKMVNQSPTRSSVAPYEYTPEVLRKVRARFLAGTSKF